MSWSKMAVQSPTTPIAYDVGMHDGDDSRYYLDKGYRVVGIDADPDACGHCASRFAEEVEAGKMVILNTGVGLVSRSQPFYRCLRDRALNSFVAPPELGDAWEAMIVQVHPLSTIIARYGAPYYVKIDVELYDALVLRDLYNANIRPPYISAEAHTIDTYCALVFMGYEDYQLVRGAELATRFAGHPIQRLDGDVFHRDFSSRSSGPFGEDIGGDWLKRDQALKDLLGGGLGWVDIHARAPRPSITARG